MPGNMVGLSSRGSAQGSTEGPQHNALSHAAQITTHHAACSSVYQPHTLAKQQQSQQQAL